jgi:hypothetical protein
MAMNDCKRFQISLINIYRRSIHIKFDIPTYLDPPVSTIYTVKLLKFSKPASTGTKKYGQFRGVAGPLQRIVQKGLKKSANIQGGSVF